MGKSTDDEDECEKVILVHFVVQVFVVVVFLLDLYFYNF